ncbi:PREDICTED: methenyltetrahydrofolate synthase domain-containing protein isoform X2 [Nicrophorus vespilloides]|uniref:Methenyltetrahydrofolate synthase domain-containing protein isoform X2 n=1 Tax=Nicrophorus vespilloides TaxID=110193 RepID=A0ABM1MIH9_NICVS|nr:PREDICTED: methenyltetrahydrofolate synthase domain-containing protein isoform X2 [Nicrophorus vespilloides]
MRNKGKFCKKEEPVTKRTFRQKVWNHLEQNKLVNFPRPVYGRIPNFVGSEEAAAKLLDLDEFKAANSVEVNPDKAQEASRIVVLEQKKKLYVPVPRLKEALLKLISVSQDASKTDIKSAVSRKGVEESGTSINIDDSVNIDLLVVGSVAVSMTGYRIGKGKGYADLEFALLMELNAITDKTTVVTVVHDSQVFEELPSDIFKQYDVPVDYILTPTRTIKVQNRLPKPKEIFWKMLSNRRLNLMPILQALKEIDEKKGIDVALKEVDTDVESYESRRFHRSKRFPRRRPRSAGKASESQGEDTSKNENRKPRRFPKPRYYRSNNQKSDADSNEVVENGNLRRPLRATNGSRYKKSYRRNKPVIDFSLMVSNIEKNVRVRDLKNALNERGIKPNEITWRGYKGFCYLHYAKPTAPKQSKEFKDEEPAAVAPPPLPARPPIIVDNVIEILQGLKISPESESNLSVKVLRLNSRIETTDVTAV